MRQRPDHRYREVLSAVQAGTIPVEPRMAALYAIYDNAPCSDELVQYAFDLHEEEEHRAILDAFLLTRCPLTEIMAVLEIDILVIETYMFLYMDVSVFRNKLEIISFAAHYESSCYGKELVKTAVQVGPEYLHWAYGRLSDTVDPRAIIRRTMQDSYFRGMAHKGNGLTTGVAKEAHKWWATAIKNAELTERMNPSTAKQALDELRIALGQRDETIAADEFEVPLSDILH
jgi:hypothetical protein